ncbi:hypothetical protein SLE2022_092620 [Rubroshorea leprosula]
MLHSPPISGVATNLTEAVSWKPLLLTIYGTMILGILYVFSAIYYPFASTARSASWLSQKALYFFLVYTRCGNSLNVDSHYVNHAVNTSQQTAMTGTRSAPASGYRLRPIWEVPPQNSKTPPLKSFRLTKELVEQRVKDNVIIVTFGNFAFMDFILTWVKHSTDLGISNLLVGAMDTKLVNALYWKGIPVFDMDSHMSTADVGWGSPMFFTMGREKAILIDSLLQYGYEILMCDTDMVWLKNPFPYLARYPDADVLTSSDQVVATVTDDRLDIWQQVRAPYNIGIFHWRPTEPAKKLAKERKDMLLAHEKIWDQIAFNNLVLRQLGPSVNGDSGLACASDGNLKLGISPASIFCNGHTFFVQAMPQQLRMEPYAVHTTFRYAGTEGNRHRLRGGRFFFDPPEYYDAPGGFLSFKPSIPKSLLLDGVHNLESSFSLVNYQIKQIRSALAVALLLNRTLLCLHRGADYMFEVNVMLKDLPAEEFGPAINIREYSFLDNPSLPKQVKDSWLDVHSYMDCLT